MSVCASDDNSFPLRDAILSLEPIATTQQGEKIFDIAGVHGIEFDQLCYFAFSMIWRTAACKWYPGRPSVRLGTYQERFRQYLLGEAPHPVSAYVLLWFFEDPTLQKAIVSPYSQKLGSGLWVHRAVVPGMVFHVFVGGQADASVRELALGTDGPKIAICGNESELPHIRHFARALRAARRT